MEIFRASILAVSPHPDDIALSCGGLMRKLIGSNLTLVTCFSRSSYAPEVNKQLLAVDDIYKLRCLEDKKYAARISAKRIDFMLDAASLRFKEPSLRLQECPEHEDIYYQLVEKFLNLFKKRQYSIVLCPLAIGNHVDHHFVRDAIENFGNSSFQVLYYEDLPYSSWIGGARAVAELVQFRQKGVVPFVVDITENFPVKLADISLYQSQVSSEDLYRVKHYAEEFGERFKYAERIWCTTGARVWIEQILQHG